jgi:transcriptional regulator GlxA family with amidase domain
MYVIEHGYDDPTLTPSKVAAEILVSDRTLRRVFAAMGTTPRTEIERRRVREVKDLRSHFGVSHPFEQLSETAGFGTGRQARAALRRA